MKHILTLDQLNENIEEPKIWYHGTNKMFDRFDTKYMSQNFEASTLGLYFTEYLKPLPYGTTAREYANEIVAKYGGHPVVYKCKLSFNKPLVIDSNGWDSSVLCLDKQRSDIRNWLKADTFDAIICYDFSDYSDYSAVVFDPDQIQILEIITGNELKGINF